MFGHAGDVVSERSGFLTRLGGVESEELGEGLTILRVLVDAKLDVFAESCVEFIKLLAVLRNLVEQFKGLLDNVFLDDLHDLVLLKGLTRQIQRQILRVDNTLDETQPFWDKVGRIVGDENTSNIKLDVVLGLLSLKKIEGCTLWDEEDSAELKLTLDGEMLDGEMVFPITVIVVSKLSIEIRNKQTYFDNDL